MATRNKDSQPNRKVANSPISTLKSASKRTRDGVSDIMTATRRKSGDVIGDAREKSYRAAGEANRIFQDHPVATIAAAAAVGAAIGIFMPRLKLASRGAQLVSRAVGLAATAETARAVLSGLNGAGEAARKAAAESADTALSAAQRGAKAARSAAAIGAEAARNAAHVSAETARSVAHTGVGAAREGIAHLPSAKAVRATAEKVSEEVASVARRAVNTAKAALKDQ